MGFIFWRLWGAWVLSTAVVSDVVQYSLSWYAQLSQCSTKTVLVIRMLLFTAKNFVYRDGRLIIKKTPHYYGHAHIVRVIGTTRGWISHNNSILVRRRGPRPVGRHSLLTQLRSWSHSLQPICCCSNGGYTILHNDDNVTWKMVSSIEQV